MSSPRLVACVEGEYPAQVGEPASYPVDLPEAVVGGDESLAAGGGQHVRELVSTGAWVDGHEHRAGDRRRDHGFDELGMVAHHDREAVAGHHVELHEPGGDALGVLGEIRVGAHLVGRRSPVEREVLEGEHVEVGLFLGTQRDEIREDHLVAFSGRAHRSAPPRPGAP